MISEKNWIQLNPVFQPHQYGSKMYGSSLRNPTESGASYYPSLQAPPIGPDIIMCPPSPIWSFQRRVWIGGYWSRLGVGTHVIVNLSNKKVTLLSGRFEEWGNAAFFRWWSVGVFPILDICKSPRSNPLHFLVTSPSISLNGSRRQ